MEADPTNFNGSNKHKSLCKKIKLNSPILIIGDVTFLFVMCPSWWGSLSETLRQTGEQRFVRAAKLHLQIACVCFIIHPPRSEPVFVILTNTAKWDCGCGELPHQLSQHPRSSTRHHQLTEVLFSHWTEKKGPTQPVKLG